MLFIPYPKQFIVLAPHSESEAYHRAHAAFSKLVPDAAHDFLAVAADIADQIIDDIDDDEELLSSPNATAPVHISEQHWSEIACALEARLSRQHQLPPV